MGSAISGRPTHIIRPTRGWVPLRLGELWEYRELFWFLTWRDVKVRYKQTALGASWAVLQPLLTMLVFSLFFGKLAGVPSEGVPYPVFAFAALVPWTFFANSLNLAGNSLVQQERILSKVYFPRLVLPGAAVLSGLLDLGLSLAVLLGIMAYYGITPGLALLALPLLLLLAAATALGVGLWLAALNVKYRDVRHTLVFLTQLWLFASPVAYATSLVPEGWRAVYALNPMVGVIDGTRWALLDVGEPPGLTLAVSGAVVVAILVGGLYYFRRLERSFADLV
jgi:lipopolysaccharide transport system permease protein